MSDVQPLAQLLQHVYAATFRKGIHASRLTELRVCVLSLMNELAHLVGIDETRMLIQEEYALYTYIVALKHTTSGRLRDRMFLFVNLPPFPNVTNRFASSSKLLKDAGRLYNEERVSIQREMTGFLCLAYHLPRLPINKANRRPKKGRRALSRSPNDGESCLSFGSRVS